MSQSKVSERLKVLCTKMPQMYCDDGDEREGTNDGQGNTSSTGRKVMKYHLHNFDENNMNPSVYFSNQKINFDEFIETPDVDNLKQNCSDMKKKQMKEIALKYMEQRNQNI